MYPILIYMYNDIYMLQINLKVHHNNNFILKLKHTRSLPNNSSHDSFQSSSHFFKRPVAPINQHYSDSCSEGGKLIFSSSWMVLLATSLPIVTDYHLKKMNIYILRISSEGTKLKFREVERVALKICLLNSRLYF